MTVRIERHGAVWTVVLERPEVRNAVDGPTARALADAFREFDADPEARVAVLWGAGGTFCAGADLHALSNPLDADLGTDGPMGPTRLALGKPVIAAISGYAVAGGWSWRCGATCASSSPMRSWASSAGGGACR